MDERIKGVITRAVQDASRYPFLFVGSGLSRRYTGAPGWDGLLSEICEEVLDNPYAYARYKSRARIAVQNNEVKSELPFVATLMENDVNHALFSGNVFSEFRDRHSCELDGEASPLKIYAADKIAACAMEANNESIYDALLASNRMYSTRFIRELRGSVFRLAERIDPASDVVVSGIDNVLNNLDPEQKIVIGLSVSPTSIGRPISAEDIFEDVVLDDLHYDPKFIVENYLNMYVRRFPNNMPVFKYTRGLGDDMVGKDIAAYLPTLTSVDSYRSNTMRKSMPSTRRRFEAALSVTGIADACAPNSPFPFIPCLEEAEINVDDLEKVLKQALVNVEGNQAAKKKLLKDSNFRKCIRIYDFLRYRT